VGAEAGYRMRSGLLLVLGDAGPMLGAGMGGGTLLVAGSIASSASAIEEDRLRDADRLRMSLLLLKVGLEVKPSKLRVFRSVHAP
jgi:glutamate synthase domain-containing protein 3